MKWSKKKSEKQEQVDIAEAAIVSAVFLVFLYYGIIKDSPFIIMVDILTTFVIVYSSYVISKYRTRLEKYREGLKEIERVLDKGAN